ncbi:MAG: hypothetical protein ACC742_05255 [Thermoanaerobaculales bacterium]
MRKLILVLCLALLAVAVAAPAAAAGGHLEGYVAAVSHVQGKFGSFWTSDLWIYHQGASVIHLWFNPSGQDNTNAQSVVVNLDGPVTYIPDVVATLFGEQGSGSLHYLADGPVVVLSRNWTPAEDAGTYGQTIRGVPMSSASFAGTGQAGTTRMLANKKDGFRANLGLVNVSPAPVEVLVEIFNEDGNPALGNSSFTVNLEPFEWKQMNDVLKRLGAGERDGLIVRAGVSSSDGAIIAYLAEVDNTTNAPSYQQGFRFAF